ncbi:MAG: (E)-4-hydroxy-3-methylbut-2-enyl-diphosphate synthase [Bacteroidales bacterium]|nr:(E)-4-hydroxy-3-methylbut-2-enyl-diphosphate synthase [Bacteroidales bacterium]
MLRFSTREVQIGNRPLGGQNPIRLQSMTNTAPLDTRSTVEQAIRIFEAGADYVRISTPSRQSALNLESIKKELRLAGFDQPLVADIHFNADLALIAARLVEKVRINPGNYTGLPRKGQTEWTDAEYAAELEKVRENVAPLIDACRQYGTSIRIGTNFGSLSQRIISRHGNTPEGMVQSTFEFLKIFEDLGFYQSVVSLKASNPLIMIRSYLLMVERMQHEGMAYPLHLGVTEAGEGENGRIKSALGIGTLLKMGIGDTIRVSLSEAPEDEIPVARKIAQPFQEYFTAGNNPKVAFSVKPFEWQTSHSPLLPGGHKAIVVLPLSEREEMEKDPDYFFVSKSGSHANHPKKELVETGSGKRLALLGLQELANNNERFYPDINFIEVNFPGDKPFLPLFKKAPGLVLVCTFPEREITEQVEALCQQLEKLELKAAIVPRLNYLHDDEESFMLSLTADAGALLLQRKIHGLFVEAPNLPNQSNIASICFGLLQASGLRITRTEYISCPTCARTSFDLVKLLKQVKDKTSRFPGLKIAVMGCVVNGPGEMADADYGIMGAGPGKVHLYKGNQPIMKNIDQDKAAETLEDLIKNLIINT